MKLTLTFAISLMISFCALGQNDFVPNWNNEIEVNSGKSKIGKEAYYCYWITVYEANKGDLRNLVREQVEQRSNDKASKKQIKEGIKIALPKYTNEPITVKATTEDVKGSDDIMVRAAFLFDSITVNPDMPKAHEAALEVMHNLSVNLNKAVVIAQIEETKEAVDDLNKEREKLLKEKESIEKSLANATSKKSKLEGNAPKLEKKLAEAESSTGLLEAAANSATASADDMKDFNKADGKVTKAKDDISKNNADVLKEQEKINEANLNLPENAEAIQRNIEDAREAQELLSKLEIKLRGIQ